MSLARHGNTRTLSTATSSPTQLLLYLQPTSPADTNMFAKISFAFVFVTLASLFFVAEAAKGPKITNKVYFDIKHGDKELGRSTYFASYSGFMSNVQLCLMLPLTMNSYHRVVRWCMFVHFFTTDTLTDFFTLPTDCP